MAASHRLRDLSVYPHPFCAGYWHSACGEMKNIYTLIFASLIIAIRIALKQVFIPVGDGLNIYVGFLFTAVGGSVYGPVIALIAGAITDLIGFVIAPSGPFNPVFTLIEILTTFLYALFLYRQKITFGRIFLTKLSVNLLGNIVANSLAMALLYGKGVYYYLVPRIIKNIVLLPFEVVLLTAVFGALIYPMIRLRLYSAEQNALVLKKSSYILLAVVTAAVLAGAVFCVVHYAECKAAFKAFADSIFRRS